MLFRRQKEEVRVQERQNEKKKEGIDERLSLIFNRDHALPGSTCLSLVLSLDVVPALVGPSLFWATSLCIQFISLCHLLSFFVIICLYFCFSS